ncbi:hypothetical protein Pint_26662 [Pistacia integerrima]|uniref:Uncharacterized protein n=1 Tax=Pistacia integerrima TaxID=434235 RepID=A0ACC0YQ32_9ROSI|nr:hypothetical protein Pint_26662 [Pistacia integerrima]
MNVEPLVVQNLNICSGETYSVLIKTDQDPSRNYWLTTNVVARNATTPPGIAILNYQPNRCRAAPSTVAPPSPLWSDIAPRLNQGIAIKARQLLQPPTPDRDKTIVLLNTQNLVDGYYRWSINNVSLNLPHTPYLIALKDNISNAFDHPPPEGFDLIYKNQSPQILIFSSLKIEKC